MIFVIIEQPLFHARDASATVKQIHVYIEENNGKAAQSNKKPVTTTVCLIFDVCIMVTD